MISRQTNYQHTFVKNQQIQNPIKSKNLVSTKKKKKKKIIWELLISTHILILSTMHISYAVTSAQRIQDEQNPNMFCKCKKSRNCLRAPQSWINKLFVGSI